MTDMSKGLSKEVMASAIEADLYAAWASLGRAPGSELYDGPDAMWALTRIPDPAYNIVTRVNFEGRDAGAEIDKTLAQFTAWKMPATWWLGPSASPAGIGDRLEARGLSRIDDQAGMAVDLRTLPPDGAAPSGLTITDVEDRRALKQLVHTAVIGTNRPQYIEDRLFDVFDGAGFGKGQSWRHYLGALNGEPVATASLFLGDGVAGIYDVRTIPEVRRQGIGYAVTLRAICEGRDLGYRIGALQSSPMGYGVYRRIGFNEYFRFRQYVWDPFSSG